MERRAWPLLAFAWQGWNFAYRSLQSRFRQPNHCSRVDSTDGFLSPDWRSSNVVNPLWMVRVYSFWPYSRAIVIQNHSQDDTHYNIKCQIPSLSTCFSLTTSMVSYFPIYLFIQPIFICQVLNFIYFSHKVILNIKMFQTSCIIFWKPKARLIWIWRTLQNARLCLITKERQLKLELDENIFVKHNPSKLAWKLSSNSLI